jgi:hypothetical protein
MCGYYFEILKHKSENFLGRNSSSFAERPVSHIALLYPGLALELRQIMDSAWMGHRISTR